MTYAPYVASAFAVYLLVFAWDLLAPLWRHHRLRARILRQAGRAAVDDRPTQVGGGR